MSAEAVTDQEVLENYDLWFESDASIRSHDGLGWESPPAMNELQERINEAIQWCEANGEPCRLIILKNRKEGASTFLVGKCYHLMRQSIAHCLLMGDKFSTTQTIWDMLENYQQRDRFEWPNVLRSKTKSAQSGHGSWTHGSTAWTDTAGEARAGHSKTPTAIVADEAAHYGKDSSAANAPDMMLSLLQSIAETAGTYVFVASTAHGVGNWYHRTYTGASTLEEFKVGRRGNGWIKIFFPWHGSQWTWMPVTDQERHDILATLTKSEQEGVRKYGWTPEQIKWRRDNIAKKCDGDENKFNQENPEDEESAFIRSGRPVFNKDALDRLDVLVKYAKPQHGVLEENAGNVIFRPDEGGWLTVFEMPMTGKSYLSAVDTCRHAQAAGAKEPDEHSAHMLRKTYMDHAQRIIPTRLAATIRSPCRWDPALLAKNLALLNKFYGNPMIVPEVNQGLDVLQELRKLQVTIYKRKKFDRANNGQQIEILGWETSDTATHSGSRSILVNAILNALHANPPALDIEDKDTVTQLKTFVWNSAGKATAAQSCHDDRVMALGIALACIDSASVYNPKMPEAWLPDWLDQSGGEMAGNRACL